MAAPKYGTPEQWKNDLLGGNTDPVARLLLEIYNQSYNATPTGMLPITAATDGTATYTNTNLIGATLNQVFVGGIGLDPATAYTFDDATGTITWTDTPDADIAIFILYTA